MRKVLLFIAAVAVIALPIAARAADFRYSQSGNVTVNKTEAVNNLYVGGSTVTSNATVSGDMVAAGSDVLVNGDVAHSLFAVGSTVNVRGNVGQNARLAGSNVTVYGNVAEDLMMAGTTLRLDSGSTVKGNVYFAGANVNIDGHVKGTVEGTSANVTINGIVDGDVDLTKSAKVTIGDNAVINGNFVYSSNEVATISPSAKILGTTTFNKVATNGNQKSYLNVVFSTASVLSLLMSLVLLFVLVYVAPRPIKALMDSYRDHMAGNTGIGIAVLFVAPIALLILAFTVVGIKLAGLLFAFYVTFAVLAMAVSTLMIGAEARRLFDRGKTDQPVDWLTILIGEAVRFVLLLIPVIGWITLFVFYLLAFGTIVRTSFTALRKA